MAFSGASTVHRLGDDLAAHDCQHPGGRPTPAPGGQPAQHEGADVQLCFRGGACAKEAGAVGVECSMKLYFLSVTVNVNLFLKHFIFDLLLVCRNAVGFIKYSATLLKLLLILTVDL